MEAIKLQSMTDFIESKKPNLQYLGKSSVSEIQNHINETYTLFFKYCNFLKQPLQLGFFVPCDENGNVLEPLKGCCLGLDCGCMGMPVNVGSTEEMNEVLEAESKVLFKGFEIRDKGNFYFVERKESTLFRRVLNKNTKSTIEDLLIWGNVELAETAIKQIGI